MINRSKIIYIFFLVIISAVLSINSYSQKLDMPLNFSLTFNKVKSDNFSIAFKKSDKYTLINSIKFKSAAKPSKSASVLPISIGVLTAIYIINPLVEYVGRKVYAGLTKEISIGFGKFGEHRTAFEYSIVFGGKIKNYLRLSYKYDILLKTGIKPSHMLQGTSVLSVGAGYFTDFKGNGIFPELTYGYSIRNHKLLFYPHIKIRHTFMFTKDKPEITDLSFGVILGIANPFIDVNIRRKY